MTLSPSPAPLGALCPPPRLAPWGAAKDYPQVTLYTFARHSMATRTKREAEKKAIEEAARRIGNTAEVARAHYIQ